MKLLDAIAALCSNVSGKAPSVDTATTSSAQSTRPEDRAERRQVTVMFSDLVGSTALSARMDPEDLREVISAYQKCVADTVQRFGGFVAKYMGDGVLIYFGYPYAHEDDAASAIRGSLVSSSDRRVSIPVGSYFGGRSAMSIRPAHWGVCDPRVFQRGVPCAGARSAMTDTRYPSQRPHRSDPR